MSRSPSPPSTPPRSNRRASRRFPTSRPSRPASTSSRFNLSGFRTIIEGAQRSIVQSIAGITQAVIKNAAKVRIMGVEGELVVRPPVPGLTLSASASYIDNKYLDFTVLGPLGPEDHTKENFQFVSKGKVTLTGEYETKLSDRLGAQLSVDYSWESSKPGDECMALATPTAPSCWTTTLGPRGGFTAQEISQQVYDAARLPATTVVNARLTFTLDENYQFSVWGRNLTDDRAYLHVQYIDASNRNYVSGSRRDPRTYGVTASAKF